MRITKKLAGLAAAVAVAFAGAAPVARAESDYAHQLRSTQTFPVAPNATQTFRMPIQRLHENQNSLLPCWGLELHGPGIDLVAADLPPTGFVAEDWYEIDQEEGGRIGVERRPDGTFFIGRPQPVTDAMVRGGIACASVGWQFMSSTGVARLDPFGRPVPTAVGGRAARAGRARATRLRAAVRRSRRAATGRRARARASQAGPVEVVSAELNVPAPGREPDIVVTLRTGDVPAGTELTTIASVLPQRDGV